MAGQPSPVKTVNLAAPIMNKIMRIGIVCYPTFGGSGVLATELGKALADKGHHIHFISYQQPVRLNGFIPNIFYHEVRVPTYPLFDYPPYETALVKYDGGCDQEQPPRPFTCTLCHTARFGGLYGEKDPGKTRQKYSGYNNPAWH